MLVSNARKCVIENRIWADVFWISPMIPLEKYPNFIWIAWHSLNLQTSKVRKKRKNDILICIDVDVDTIDMYACTVKNSESKPLISIWLKLQEAYGNSTEREHTRDHKGIPTSVALSKHQKNEMTSVRYATCSLLRWKSKSQTHWFDNNRLWNADYCCQPKMHSKSKFPAHRML